MKAAELRTLSASELEQKGRELRDELFDARIRRSTEQLENTARLGQLRKDIARVETLLTEKREAGK
ncbi:MAG: 50S ribosomal protein L29 [Spirochaetaceae bacterium]|nr:50S ribosomal protein L29 [Myxococcales bacterium]MCB9723730.1 50S ribosomal protein L29 [Spirochaetaceae bacterium]